MHREHRPAPWFDHSQVFADTQKVDLFNDPPWETSVRTSPRRATEDVCRVSWRSAAKNLLVGRVLVKRGQHSRLAG
jgi:hypothetical protein